MANQIPPWLTGLAVTNIVITPLTVNPDGTFTLGTAQSLSGHLDEIALEQYNLLENITPLDSRQDNEVIVGSGTTIQLIEILAKSGGNSLSSAGNGFDYIDATFTRGGSTYTGTFVVKGYKETIRRGKSVGILTMSPCGTGISYT